LRQEIGESKSVPLDDLTDCDRQPGTEHRPRICESMELAVLAAGIDIARKIRQQFLVKAAPGE
jgi:hypothetical protein